jgi:pimeloyl-ACP methyl ester carboxylesterase
VTDKRTKVIDTGDAQIEVVLRGKKGPLIVMYPGNGRGAEDFDHLAGALYEAGWRSAAIHPRGAAGSQGPLESITLHSYTGDIAAVVKALDGAPAAVLGHAFGNRVARCFASDYPEMVRCLVLLAAGGKLPMALEVKEAIGKLRKGLSTDEIRAAFKIAYFAKDSNPDAWLTGVWPKSMKANRIAGQSTPIEGWWSGGEAPTLVIQGKEDRCALPENGYLLKREYGDRITVIDIENAAHALLPEQPERIAKNIINYLKDYRD